MRSCSGRVVRFRARARARARARVRARVRARARVRFKVRIRVCLTTCSTHEMHLARSKTSVPSGRLERTPG